MINWQQEIEELWKLAKEPCGIPVSGIYVPTPQGQLFCTGPRKGFFTSDSAQSPTTEQWQEYEPMVAMMLVMAIESNIDLSKKLATV